MPELERVQARADTATFERRASAVEQERAIAENELENRIQLARQEELLVAQEAENERRRTEAEAERAQIEARGQAARIETVEGAEVAAERERLAVYAALPPGVLQARALRDLAANMPDVEHLTVTPELLTPLVTRLAGTR